MKKKTGTGGQARRAERARSSFCDCSRRKSHVLRGRALLGGPEQKIRDGQVQGGQGKVQLLLRRREVRQAPRCFKDERRHASSARRARRRQGRKSLFKGENFASASRSAAGAAELQRRASPRLLGTAGSQTTKSQEWTKSNFCFGVETCGAQGAAGLQRRASPRLLGTTGSQTARSQEPFHVS